MKRFFYVFVLLSILFFSCASPKKLVQKGEYDEAVKVAVRRLKRNPQNLKQAQILQIAYNKANEKDLQQINYLLKEGQPSNWDKIYSLYLRLKKRQQLVESVTPLQIGNFKLSFPHYDYDSKIIQAKNKAAEYHYALAMRYMRENTKYSYRQAYYEFKRAKYYNPAYDINRYLQICLANGTTYILLKPVNRTIYRLPKSFLYDLVDLPLDKLNSQWIIYENRKNSNHPYDIIVYIELNAAKISGNNQNQRQFTQSRKIKVGEITRRDSAGNVIKIPQYKVVSCTVQEVSELKNAKIYGQIKYYDVHTKQFFLTIPISAENVFNNVFAVVAGDKRACSDRILDETQRGFVAFPSDIAMIVGAEKTLKNVIWRALYDHRRYIAEKY